MPVSIAKLWCRVPERTVICAGEIRIPFDAVTE
jgi:hypothetical protein